MSSQEHEEISYKGRTIVVTLLHLLKGDWATGLSIDGQHVNIIKKTYVDRQIAVDTMAQIAMERIDSEE